MSFKEDIKHILKNFIEYLKEENKYENDKKV